MMSEKSEWEVVVPPLPKDEAEQKFRQWKKDQEDKGVKVHPEDVRRDQIFKGPGKGCLVRYLVKL